MYAINRAVAVIKLKQPYIDWANSLPDMDHEVRLEDLNRDCTVFLISEYDFEEEAWEFIRTNWRNIFELELHDWYTDESYWPKNLSYDMFLSWFEVEFHSTVIDPSRNKIKKEEY